MIDFEKITKTLDGFDCHYFGTRQSCGSTLHCFGVFHPQYGVHEAAYDSQGKRLRFDTGEWVESTATNYQIVKPKRKVEVVRWLAFVVYPPDFIGDEIAVHVLIREPTDDEIEQHKYFKVEKNVWTVEVPEPKQVEDEYKEAQGMK